MDAADKTREAPEAQRIAGEQFDPVAGEAERRDGLARRQAGAFAEKNFRVVALSSEPASPRELSWLRCEHKAGGTSPGLSAVRTCPSVVAHSPAVSPLAAMDRHEPRSRPYRRKISDCAGPDGLDRPHATGFGRVARRRPRHHRDLLGRDRGLSGRNQQDEGAEPAVRRQPADPFPARRRDAEIRLQFRRQIRHHLRRQPGEIHRAAERRGHHGLSRGADGGGRAEMRRGRHRRAGGGGRRGRRLQESRKKSRRSCCCRASAPAATCR